MAQIILDYNISNELEKLLNSDVKQITKYIKQVENACLEADHGDNFTPFMAIRNLNLTLMNEPGLLKCEPATIISYFIDLALLGLLANTGAKEAHIITYIWKGITKAELRIGVAGYCKIIQKIFPNSKINTHLLSISDTVTHKIIDGDSKIEIDVDYTDRLNLNKKENILGVHISLKYNDYLREDIVPINYINDVERSRKGRGGDYDAWVKHYGAMAKKTALIKFCKDLIQANQSKFPEVFYDALEAERDSSGFPALKPEIRVSEEKDVLKEFEEMIEAGEKKDGQ